MTHRVVHFVMLKLLAIKDLAIVRTAELEFTAGMTVVSGETGAGKSLIVDALGLLSGLRADSGMVRHGATRAEVFAEFALDATPSAHNWLTEHEMDEGASCQLRRVVRADGGSRAWINGRPVTLAQLSDLTRHLVEIHGQHEHQALLSRSNQLALLDTFADNAHERSEVYATAMRWNALRQEHEALIRQGDVAERIAYLEHQLTELEHETLSPDGIGQLIQKHRQQAHAQELTEACEQAIESIQIVDEVSALSQLRRARNDLSRWLALEPRLPDVVALLEDAEIQLNESVTLLARIRDELDIEPESLTQLEQRLSRLHDLARKHRVPLEQLADKRAELHTELATLRTSGERLDCIQRELETVRQRWQHAAVRLSASRRNAAATLSKTTTALIDELGMSAGRFSIDLTPVTNEMPDPNGAERAEFLVSANAGQPLRALRKVASGGELSRISLAIEVAVLGMDSVPTMVFDEVDSGIGGAIAEIVGRKLRTLGEKRQVLCVTHLPQVAAQGHVHYRVSKTPADGITQTAVHLLTSAEREQEIARMLGGVEIGKEARAAARRLLRNA